jgi:hypothetical protein
MNTAADKPSQLSQCMGSGGSKLKRSGLIFNARSAVAPVTDFIGPIPSGDNVMHQRLARGIERADHRMAGRQQNVFSQLLGNELFEFGIVSSFC